MGRIARLEEALTQGTGVRGPLEISADRKKLFCDALQSRAWKTIALWQSGHIQELKDKSSEWKLVYSLKTKIRVLKMYAQVILGKWGGGGSGEGLKSGISCI